MRPWGDDRPFNSGSRYFRERFGGRIQKLTVNAGFTCPNRDGTVSTGGCSFCDNSAFTPSYCMRGLSISDQIEEGMRFHARRYRRACGYVVYFQSFSNTYAPTDVLRRRYSEALSYPGVVGIVIGTRPDCVDGERLDYLASLSENHYVAVEYGIESTYDSTLRQVNRGHTFECSRRAVEMTCERGIRCGAHFILGLPGESRQMLVDQTGTINSLPLASVKFHQLQIFRNTPMAAEYDRNPSRFTLWDMETYMELITDIVRRLRPDIAVERIASEAPPRFRHADGGWGAVRNETLLAFFERRMSERGYLQGDLYMP